MTHRNREFVLIDENGNVRRFDEHASLYMVIDYIENLDIETIVVGETSAAKVTWEKQFKAVTVMPSGFGREG